MNGFIEVQTWKDLISITFLIMVSIITIFISITITIMKKINIRRLTVPSGVPATVFAVATQSNSVPQYLGGVLIVMGGVRRGETAENRQPKIAQTGGLC